MFQVQEDWTFIEQMLKSTTKGSGMLIMDDDSSIDDKQVSNDE